MGEAQARAVEWVLGCLGAGQERDRRGGACSLEAGGAPDVPDGIDWRHVVAFSSAHLVLPALAWRMLRVRPGPPGEVGEFLAGIERANIARNQGLRAALGEIGAALGETGIQPVVLKGAAFLLDEGADGEAAGWRFMSDVDLLVAGQDFVGAVRCLAGLGFRALEVAGDDTIPGRAQAMVSPCGGFAVDVHHRLGEVGAGGPKAADVIRRAQAREGGLFVPAPGDRLAHALFHAQIHNRQAVIHRLVLRDILDIQALGACIEIDGALLDAIAGAGRGRWAAGALVAAAQAFGAAPAFRASRLERAWAERALARLRRPVWRSRLALCGDTARIEAYRLLCEEGHARRRLGQLGDPRWLARSAGAWAYKQRQRLWA